MGCFVAFLPVNMAQIPATAAQGARLANSSEGHCTALQVYVGNLVSGLVAEDALRQLFNSTMRAAFPDKIVMNLDPVVAVSLHSEGRYAFVELRTPEMATASLQLSNQAGPWTAALELLLGCC